MTIRSTAEGQTPEAVSNAANVAKWLVPESFNEDADEQVLREILGADVDDELLDFAAGAGGNPRLLAELALGLEEEGLVKEYNGTIQLIRRRLPCRVLIFVKNLLDGLSANCRQFLKVAAVLGRSFLLEDVSRMLDRSSANLLPLLEDAMDSGFLVAGEHQFAFRSDFLLRGVIESIPAPARGALHREAMGRPGSAQEYYQEFRPTEPLSWVTGSVTESSHEVGGDVGEIYSRAHGLIMNGKAAAGISVAERILSNSGSSASVRLDAETSLILGYSVLGGEETEKHSERILRDRRAGQVDIAALMALMTLSNARWRVGELGEGLSLGRAAVRHSDKVDPVWRLHFQLALAGKLTSLCEFDMAESLINEAEAGLRGLSTQIWAAAPAAMRSRLFLQAGRFGDARRQAELATAAVEGDAVPMLRPLAFSVLSAASLHLGDVAAAAEHLKRMESELSGDESVLYSAQYAWTEVHVAVKRKGPHAAVKLLSDQYGYLPTQRSLYIEDPGAAAFLVHLALDIGDTDLVRSVLETVNGLAEDNPGISVVSFSAMHANALANNDSDALERVVAQSPDPISVALAKEELGSRRTGKAQAMRQEIRSACPEPPSVICEEVTTRQSAAYWAGLSDAERHIANLVSVGLTNHQIARRVHLSPHTVNYHLRKVYRKLGIKTRVELARGAAIHSMGGHGEAGQKQS